MLDKTVISDEIKDAILDVLPNAIKLGMIQTTPVKSEEAKENFQKLGEAIADMIAEPLASRIASAIDAYIKMADFSGTIITAGSPVTQTAIVMPGGMPVLNGAIPNTLKIQ